MIDKIKELTTRIEALSRVGAISDPEERCIMMILMVIEAIIDGRKIAARVLADSVAPNVRAL